MCKPYISYVANAYVIDLNYAFYNPKGPSNVQDECNI